MNLMIWTSQGFLDTQQKHTEQKEGVTESQVDLCPIETILCHQCHSLLDLERMCAICKLAHKYSSLHGSLPVT